MKTLKIVTILGALALALPAHAASLTFSPATVTVAPGATVKVAVSVDPQGATIAAVQSQLTYSSSLLTPTAFSFAPTWIPVTRSGYSQMSAGTIIESAGYPGGFTTTTLLGTITFTAKAAGIAHLAVSNSSMAYASDGTNALSGTQGSALITIAAAGTKGSGATTTSTTATSTPPAKTGTGTGTSTSARTGTVATGTHATHSTSAQIAVVSAHSAHVVTTSATLAQATSTASSSLAAQAASSTALTAAVANAAGAGVMNSIWFWIVLILIVLGIIAGAIVWYRRKVSSLEA